MIPAILLHAIMLWQQGVAPTPHLNLDKCQENEICDPSGYHDLISIDFDCGLQDGWLAVYKKGSNFPTCVYMRDKTPEAENPKGLEYPLLKHPNIVVAEDAGLTLVVNLSSQMPHEKPYEIPLLVVDGGSDICYQEKDSDSLRLVSGRTWEECARGLATGYIKAKE